MRTAIETWQTLIIACFCTTVGIVAVLVIGWMRDVGIVTWGDLFTYRRRARRMRAALARGATKCTCRTGRRTAWRKWTDHPPAMQAVDVAGWRSVDCSFCHGVGAYLPNPARTILR